MCWQRKDTCTPTHDSFLFADLVSFQYVSGSAYKIVNNRAYHHGTMLISTRLDLLGDVLRVNKVSGMYFGDGVGADHKPM